MNDKLRKDLNKIALDTFRKGDPLIGQVQYQLDFEGKTERLVPFMVRWDGKKWVEVIENKNEEVSYIEQTD